MVVPDSFAINSENWEGLTDSRDKLEFFGPKFDYARETFICKVKNRLTFVFIASLLVGIHIATAQESTTGVDHSAWDRLLQARVSDKGWVDYVGFESDRDDLKRYFEELANNPPNEEDLSSQALAYWINAYNAYTVELILQYYPLQSIRDIGSKIMIPKINSPWDIRFIAIGNQKYDLNNIEHSILRKKFKDPRIHFSIVCASYSCPRLRNRAYTADNVQRFLDDDTRIFVNDPSRNSLSADQLNLSKIFSWYKGDFTENGSLVDFLNLYSKVKINASADISFLKYDWSLNQQ